MTTETLEQMASRLVDREVYVCLSSLVSTLAQGGADVLTRGDLSAMCEQAGELCYPTQDYEEAARYYIKNDMSADDRRAWCESNASSIVDVENGGTTDADEITKRMLDHIDSDDAWRAFCDDERVEPYESEILEHWSVSTWLAEKLEARGERVDTDFAGMCVWGRSTSGQGISADGVIIDICNAIRGAK